MSKIDVKEARKQLREKNIRLHEIDKWVNDTKSAIEKEKRQMTAEETSKAADLTSEKTELLRGMQVLQLALVAAENSQIPTERDFEGKLAFARVITAMKKNRSLPDEYKGLIDSEGLIIPAHRDATVITNADTVAPLVPLTIGEIIEPLNNKIIYGKVGMKMQYGLRGNFVYPVLAQCEADFEGEDVELSDKAISMSKLTPTPHRIGLTIPVANNAIDEANYDLQAIVLGQIQQAIANLLNKWSFSATLLTGNADGGCMYAALNAPVVTTKGAITWLEVLQLETAVMKKGVIIDGTTAFVCNSSTLATLKSTPKATNTGLFIAEGNAANCTIDGFPVFITEDMPDSYLGFGVFNYNLLGQFGQARLIIDPYSQAKKDWTQFTFNTRYANLVLRSEAFAALEITAAS